MKLKHHVYVSYSVFKCFSMLPLLTLESCYGKWRWQNWEDNQLQQHTSTHPGLLRDSSVLLGLHVRGMKKLVIFETSGSSFLQNPSNFTPYFFLHRCLPQQHVMVSIYLLLSTVTVVKKLNKIDSQTDRQISHAQPVITGLSCPPS